MSPTQEQQTHELAITPSPLTPPPSRLRMPEYDPTDLDLVRLDPELDQSLHQPDAADAAGLVQRRLTLHVTKEGGGVRRGKGKVR